MPFDIEKLRTGLAKEMERRGLNKPLQRRPQLCSYRLGCGATATVFKGGFPKCAEHARLTKALSQEIFARRQANAADPLCRVCKEPKPRTRMEAATCGSECWRVFKSAQRRREKSVA